MKTARNYIIIGLLFLTQAVLIGQQGVIKGRVYNANNNTPVEFATVAIYGTTIGSISDLDGNFLFTGLEPGYVEVRVSSVGFETYVSEAIQVTNAKKVFLDIPLVEAMWSWKRWWSKPLPSEKSRKVPFPYKGSASKKLRRVPGATAISPK